MFRKSPKPVLGIPLLATLFAFGNSAFGADRATSPLANADETYQRLRQLALDDTVTVEDLEIQRDIARFRLSGTISFGQAVDGRRPLAVFTGQGELIFEPSLPWEQRNLQLHIQQNSVRETFSSAVFWFTDATEQQLREGGSPGSPDAQAENALQRVRSRLRKRDKRPGSRTEAMLQGEDMDNVEAIILRALARGPEEGVFLAYLHGKKYSDLRFFVRPGGALPQVLSPEEVALVHVKPGADDEGIWYLAHRDEEYRQNTHDSREPTSAVDALHYQLETTVQKNRKIEATCLIRFKALRDGERVVSFGLLPDLRVESVKLGGEEIAFIQEPKDADGSFHVILPEPAKKDEEIELEASYFGEDVIRSEGGGNFAVGARTSWYPSLGSFNDRATFDITFHYPKSFELVSIGQLQGEPEKGKNYTTARWVSEVPLAVAGFNYGDFKKAAVEDESIGYLVEGYATSRPPDFLNSNAGELPTQGSRAPRGPEMGNMSPKRMMERAMGEAQMSMRLFTKYFGPLPYGRVAITQQPQFSFGQSWPSLVYLPVSAFLDATQRWALLGRGAFKFSHFIQELTPHEVAHQWWGHIVGWASYHDQWLSEGLADFSAGLYLRATRETPQEYLRFLERGRDAILEKNQFGFSPNEVGPIWMGHRLITRKTSSAYRRLIYPKGGFVLHMLRQMMYDNQTGDAAFVAMMQDFVKSHHNQNASTESFKEVVERHMTQGMNLEGNGTMDWFFRQWVYGTEVPSYELAYRLEPGEGGQTQLVAKITQSGVSDEFAMPVPIYVVREGQTIRLGSMSLAGSMTSDEINVPLPFKPETVSINAFHDILASDVTVKPL